MGFEFDILGFEFDLGFESDLGMDFFDDFPSLPVFFFFADWGDFAVEAFFRLADLVALETCTLAPVRKTVMTIVKLAERIDSVPKMKQRHEYGHVADHRWFTICSGDGDGGHSTLGDTITRLFFGNRWYSHSGFSGFHGFGLLGRFRRYDSLCDRGCTYGHIHTADTGCTRLLQRKPVMIARHRKEIRRW